MPHKALIALGLATVVAVGLYLGLGLPAKAGVILALRAEKLAALVIVGAAIATATVIFQTVTANRILTPAIMGFDALYVMLQTGLVFALGGFGYGLIPAEAKFAGEAAALMAAATLLFGALLRRNARDIPRLVLVGIIFGVLFRSLTSFLERMIDPSDFGVVQAASFARFGRAETELVWASGALCLCVLALCWSRRHALDIVALGRDHAVGLGVDYDREARIALLLVSALVAVSTAMVGPVAFFGLLVVSLAHALIRDPRHALMIPAAALIAVFVLVAGQTIFERALGLASTLSVVVEFLGGLVFLALVLGARR